jgi:hypothetical protein
MLKVFIHSGTLDGRNEGNQLAVLDIGYAKKAALADYNLAMAFKGVGEVQPDQVLNYPRWAGSLWDLIARALTRILYRSDQAPAGTTPDRRCAYATRMCVVVEGSTKSDQGILLATAQITQTGNQRGFYTVQLDEDILGRRSATFAYGLKSLNPADLLLRAICWALFDRDTLGRRPALILPPSAVIDGVERFDVEALTEPARTGFDRYRNVYASAAPPDPMPPAEQYVTFLRKG